MSRDNHITVLGAGSWGTALAIRLAVNHNDTLLWGHDPDFMKRLAAERQNSEFLPGTRFPDSLIIESDLQQAMTHSRDILVVVPSHAFREVLSNAALPGQPRDSNMAAASS